MAGSSALRDRVLHQAMAAGRTRKQARKLGLGLTAASVAIAILIFEAIGGLDHSAKRPLWITLAITAGWAVASGALTWLVISRGGSTMARRPLLVLIATLAAPIVVFAWMHLFYGTYPDPAPKIGFRCLGYSLVMSILPLATFLVLRRSVEPRYPAILGAGAGAACAAWAGALMDLWCPLTDARHVLVGHVTPIVVATLVGAVAGRMLLGVRGFAREERN